MFNTSDITSKLLIIESNTNSQNQFKQFCQEKPLWKVPDTTIIDLDSLKECLSEYIYNLLYPEGMIEKLKEMTIEAIIVL